MNDGIYQRIVDHYYSYRYDGALPPEEVWIHPHHKKELYAIGRTGHRRDWDNPLISAIGDERIFGMKITWTTEVGIEDLLVGYSDMMPQPLPSPAVPTPEPPQQGIPIEEYRRRTAAEDEVKRLRFSGAITAPVEGDLPMGPDREFLAAKKGMAAPGDRLFGVKPKDDSTGFFSWSPAPGQTLSYSWVTLNARDWYVQWIGDEVVLTSAAPEPSFWERRPKKPSRPKKAQKPSAVNDLRRSVRPREWWVR